jgi:MoaA/NifB/PqqE/SkfB family radical SAM enzyme
MDEPEKRWRLWQIESAIACNLDCIMCPWRTVRRRRDSDGIMLPAVWNALRPHLNEVASIDFSGGGEPLLQPKLMEWVREAHGYGCETGFLTNGLLLNEETVEKVLKAGADWVAVSVDGATADIYEQIRKGSDFKRICKNMATLSSMRTERGPKLALNFVIMPINAHQLRDMVHVADDLGMDQINFKQCDVIRGRDGNGHGLFSNRESKGIRRLKKNLKRAQRLAKKLKLQTTAFPFVAEENPVCDQDPRTSLFIRADGCAAPCINLAYGGASTFFGKPVFIPTVHFGQLPGDTLPDIWNCSNYESYRQRFQQRIRAHDAVIANSSFEPSLIKLREILRAAVSVMPEAPEGCVTCHYLFNRSKPY